PKAWAAAHPHITFTPVLSEATIEDHWQGRTGFVHQAVLDDFADIGLSEYEVYCCGAPAMVEVAHASFLQAGLAEDAFFSDAFNYAKSVMSSTVNIVANV
ncbi:MAG: CDP-6-deoxy-delta-3,4-glucoseen reductase, partial [Methylotenera sp.]